VLYKTSDGGYVAGYQNVEDGERVIRPTFSADTPEDAVAKLVIELFKNLGEKKLPKGVLLVRANKYERKLIGHYVECEQCAPQYRHCLKCEKHSEKNSSN